jgi:hypothetical protein
LDRFYGERAVAIIRAAMLRDRGGLETLIMADATVEVWQADVGWSPASADRETPVSGGSALIALVDWLKPRGFTLVLDQPGPISLVNPNTCERAVKLLVAMTEPGQAASLEFIFRDGKLEFVRGRQMGLAEGRLP